MVSSIVKQADGTLTLDCLVFLEPSILDVFGERLAVDRNERVRACVVVARFKAFE